MTGYRSSMARLAASRPDPETVKREGWRETGIFAVHPDDPRLDEFERVLIRRLGERLYGAAPDEAESNIRRLRP